MPQISVIVINEVGLHARPAAVFVEAAKRYKSEIIVKYGDQSANAKSIISILILGVVKNSNIIIEAEGEDANQALTALKALVENNFWEKNE